jgi:predicted Zn-dependent protease
MTRRFALAILATLAVFVMPVRSETMTHAEAGVQFDVPEGWTQKADGDSIQVTNADGTLSVVFMVAAEDTWEKALDAVASELDKQIQNAKVEEEAKESEHNGMKTVEMSGSGEVSGKQIDWSLTIVAAKKPVLILAIAEPSAWEKDSPAIAQFIDSVKPAE